MKRFVICGLAVMLFAGVAHAQVTNLTLWMENADPLGDPNHIEMAPSETAVIDLWMMVPAGMILVNVDSILVSYDAGFGKNVNFSIVDFSDHNPPDPAYPLFGRTTRGAVAGVPLEELLPHQGMDDYQYVGEDANFPLTGQSGLVGDGVTPILLDNIVIHCDGETVLGPDLVLFGFAGGPAPPGGFEMTYNPITGWGISQLALVDVLNGTFGNPFLITNIPEPATLSLLLLGGLAAFRRR